MSVENAYRNLNMTGRSLADRTDMDNLEIEGLCLSQERLDSNVLPPNLTGVTFYYCNLDNVLIPPGNTLVNCSNRRYMPMDDGYDWEVDENNQPIKILGT